MGSLFLFLRWCPLRLRTPSSVRTLAVGIAVGVAFARRRVWLLSCVLVPVLRLVLLALPMPCRVPGSVGRAPHVLPPLVRRPAAARVGVRRTSLVLLRRMCGVAGLLWFSSRFVAAWSRSPTRATAFARLREVWSWLSTSFRGRSPSLMSPWSLRLSPGCSMSKCRRLACRALACYGIFWQRCVVLYPLMWWSWSVVFLVLPIPPAVVEGLTPTACRVLWSLAPARLAWLISSAGNSSLPSSSCCLSARICLSSSRTLSIRFSSATLRCTPFGWPPVLAGWPSTTVWRRLRRLTLPLALRRSHLGTCAWATPLCLMCAVLPWGALIGFRPPFPTVTSM